MKKLAVLGAGSIAIASAAVFGPVVAHADPPNTTTLNVVGEPYGKAVSILKSQGVKSMFGGSKGSGSGGDLPQQQCIVYQQTVISSGKMRLMLDCSPAAAAEAADSQPAAGSTAGAPGGTQTPGAGQGTYGNPIGVPIPVG